MKNKNWIEIRERKTKKLIRIVYNPYGKPAREVVGYFIAKENLNKVYYRKVGL